MGLHVIIEKQEKLTDGSLRAAVAGGSLAPVFLLEHGESKRQLEPAQCRRRLIRRAVDHDEHLERGCATLVSERVDGADDDVATLKRWNDDADPTTGRV